MVNKLMNNSLTVYSEEVFQGYIVNQKYTLAEEYLLRLGKVMDRALDDWSRVMLFHATLKFPDCYRDIDTPDNQEGCISRFIESFKAKLKADYAKKVKSNKTAYQPKVHYAWARERDSSLNDHFHVFIFLNGDAYRGLGLLYSDRPNTSSRITGSWRSAIKLERFDVRGLVHFTNSMTISRNSRDYLDQCDKAFFWLSYLAKIETKQFGDKVKSFSCSM
ncbi:MAG: hypothetical protein ACJAXS_001356 [Colwellia sp.]